MAKVGRGLTHLANVILVSHVSARSGELVISGSVNTHDPYDRVVFEPERFMYDVDGPWEAVFAGVRDELTTLVQRHDRVLRQGGPARPPNDR